MNGYNRSIGNRSRNVPVREVVAQARHQHGVGVAGDRRRAQEDTAQRRPQTFHLARLVDRHGSAVSERAPIRPRHASDLALLLVRPRVMLEVQVRELHHQRPQVGSPVPVTERFRQVESPLCVGEQRLYPLEQADHAGRL
jgi:hypothetical protein